MSSLDPEGPILSLLFAGSNSDTVIQVVDRSGLRVDWDTSELKFSTNTLRKRLFRPRVGDALKSLDHHDRMKCLSVMIGAMLELNAASSDVVNRTLAPAGWLYEGELLALVQGGTDPTIADQRVKGDLTAVIATALELETQAVKEHLADIAEQEHKGTVYFVGRFDGAVRWRVAIVTAGQGNPAMAAEVERAVAHFGPALLMLVGVAGGLKDVSIGDVVAAEKVYGYERGKSADEFFARPTFGMSTYPAIQRARVEVVKNEWQARILPKPPDQGPAAIVAPIAAGEKVIASKDTPEYRAIRKLASDAAAVEMEGAGFLTGAHINIGVNALVVRGISDMLEGKAAADAAGSQLGAARNAAAFAFQVLANLVAAA